MKQRTTRDEWEIQGNYGYGWDVECTEDNSKDARQRLREYRDNGTGLYRIVKRRIKTQPGALQPCGPDCSGE